MELSGPAVVAVENGENTTNGNEGEVGNGGGDAMDVDHPPQKSEPRQYSPIFYKQSFFLRPELILISLTLYVITEERAKVPITYERYWQITHALVRQIRHSTAGGEEEEATGYVQLELIDWFLENETLDSGEDLVHMSRVVRSLINR